MITPLKLKFPFRVSLPVTINVPCPVGLPGPSVRSPSTNVNTPSGLFPPRPAVRAIADAPLVKYRPWLMADCFIPSSPYRNSLAMATLLRHDGVLLLPRTPGLPGVPFGPLLLQLVPSALQPSITLFVRL